jgi:hypothetical protein
MGTANLAKVYLKYEYLEQTNEATDPADWFVSQFSSKECLVLVRVVYLYSKVQELLVFLSGCSCFDRVLRVLLTLTNGNSVVSKS